MGTSIGATVQLHYCMGKLSDWGVGRHGTNKCSKCGMAKSPKQTKGCCKDEHKFFKNDTDQKASESVLQVMQALAAAPPVSYFEVVAPSVSTITEESPVSHAPPRADGLPVYIRNCVFLI